MQELINKLKELEKKIKNVWQALNLDADLAQITKLEKQTVQPDFWQDTETAQKTTQELNDLKTEITKWNKLKKETAEALELAELDKTDKEVNFREELEKKFIQLEQEFYQQEFLLLFSGVYDKNSAILAVHAGAGGDDAQDWASMLLRMYLRFAEKKGFTTKIIDQSSGGEVGIKSVMVEIKGRYAYGYLKAEAGVHRLVRISPFDAEAMRHTSFALVEVLPELAAIDLDQIEIKDEDLKIETFRAGGHGGQSVNTTDSAVRITHLPSGIKVSCQNERSQLQNKDNALKLLKTRLHQSEISKQLEQKKELRGEYQSAEWGSQIRSYVLHPYKLVKDNRTKFETKDPAAVLDGDLEELISAYLRMNIKS